VLKTRRIPRTLSALLLVELSIQGFYWIFATLAHAQNKSWCSRTNPDTRVYAVVLALIVSYLPFLNLTISHSISDTALVIIYWISLFSTDKIFVSCIASPSHCFILSCSPSSDEVGFSCLVGDSAVICIVLQL